MSSTVSVLGARSVSLNEARDVTGQQSAPTIAAVARVLNMIFHSSRRTAGLINAMDVDVTTFALADVNDAVAHSAANAGPFQKTVLLTGRSSE